jgi:SAM-dependent methyltransferase
MTSIRLSTYAGAAALYARARAAYPAEALSYLKSVLPISSSSRLIDLGCGPGTLSVQLARHAASVAAIDAEQDMLDVGVELVKGAGIRNISWICARAEELAGLPVWPADHLLVARAFHWMNREVVARIAADHLPAHGCIVILQAKSLPHPSDAARRRATEDTLRGLGIGGANERWEVGSSGDVTILRQAGFSVINQMSFSDAVPFSPRRLAELRCTKPDLAMAAAARSDLVPALESAIIAAIGDRPVLRSRRIDILVARRPSTEG